MANFHACLWTSNNSVLSLRGHMNEDCSFPAPQFLDTLVPCTWSGLITSQNRVVRVMPRLFLFFVLRKENLGFWSWKETIWKQASVAIYLPPISWERLKEANKWIELHFPVLEEFWCCPQHPSKINRFHTLVWTAEVSSVKADRALDTGFLTSMCVVLKCRPLSLK